VGGAGGESRWVVQRFLRGLTETVGGSAGVLGYTPAEWDCRWENN
jgi:hypothetical protein